MSPTARKLFLVAMPVCAFLLLAYSMRGELSDAGSAVEAQSAAAHSPLTLTSGTFATTIQTPDKPVLVDFWAPWCGPCRMVAPAVEGVAAEMADKAIVAKLNVDKAPEIAKKYSVDSIPTLIIFKNGREVDRMVGVVSQNQIRARLTSAIR